MHFTSFSEIKASGKAIDNIVMEKPTLTKKISEFNANDNVSSRAFIVQMFEPRFFYTCPECRKKAVDNQCQEHGRVVADKKALLNFVIDDGSDSMRSVVFSEQLEKMMTKDEIENPELFAVKKNDLLGKEMIVKGQVRVNSLFGNNEFIINGLEEVNMDKLIEELEK